MKLKIVASLLLSLLLISSVISCTKGEDSSTKEKDFSGKELTLSLDWTPNTNHTGFYVAEKLGYYEEEGIELKIVQPHQSSVNQLVASGEVDFGITVGYSLIKAVENGLPVKNIATILASHTSSFYSLATKPLLSLEDFVGSTYGGWSSPLADGMFLTMMEAVGEPPSVIRQVTSSTNDLLTLLQSGEVDFIWGYDGWQLIEGRERGMDIVSLPLATLETLSSAGTFAPPEPILITSDESINTKIEWVRRFLRASRRGFEYTISHPAESAEIFIEMVPEIEPRLVRESQEYLSPLYAEGVSEWGVNREEEWQEFADWMFSTKLTDRRLAVSEFVWTESYEQL